MGAWDLALVLNFPAFLETRTGAQPPSEGCQFPSFKHQACHEKKRGLSGQFKMQCPLGDISASWLDILGDKLRDRLDGEALRY